MKNEYLVSVVLCTYNGEKYLEEQLNSILNQTYKNIEIIISDDCSTDNTLEILEKYRYLENFHIFLNKENLGFNKNFELAISKANGYFIALCDQDDLWELDKIEILVSSIDENSLVYANSMLVDENLKSLNKTLEEKLKVNFISSNSMLSFIFGNCVSAHAMMFKKEMVSVFNFPKNIYFDQYIAMVCASKNGVKYIDRNLVFYRQHSNNTLAQNGVKKRKSIFHKIKTKLEKKVKDNEDLKNIVKVMKDIPTIKKDEKIILDEYTICLNQFMDRYFNLKLFFLLYKNRKLFFSMSKKSSFKQSFNKSIGYKLYKVLPLL
ncbi:glycosyltransferase, family 2 [Aliarcobacter cibarius]|uniref:glycosyltransferase n=1 Tax=Aliarcobacter cibarius TaxID=255507 RepID=UPI00124933CC|nr:glycosyltransferase [Aliarcobacter cibarius]QEZ88616.1 glycosyltransferase, family 2 [Aliarcobacter cibarius]